jgi:surfeit locus 1 family protein
LVIVMVNLGLWQLRRLDERRDFNDRVTSRQEEKVAPLAELIGVEDSTDGGEADSLEYRTATASGTYEAADTVTVANRTLDGAPGGWVLTPLRLADGSAVVVNRGFLGFDRDGDLVPPEPPSGTVEVTGLVQNSQTRGRFGPTDPTGEKLETLARADLDRYQAQLDYEILPVYLQLESSEPAEDEAAAGEPALVPLEPPELDEGPHLSYAVQWFIFSAIALAGYPLILRKVARQEAAAQRADEPGERDDIDRELEALIRSQP